MIPNREIKFPFHQLISKISCIIFLSNRPKTWQRPFTTKNQGLMVHEMKIIVFFSKSSRIFFIKPINHQGFSNNCRYLYTKLKALLRYYLLVICQTLLSVSDMSNVIICFWYVKRYYLFLVCQTLLSVSDMSNVIICFWHVKHYYLFLVCRVKHFLFAYLSCSSWCPSLVQAVTGGGWPTVSQGKVTSVFHATVTFPPTDHTPAATEEKKRKGRH